MRTIFLLRGCPASGKNYWISKNNLEPYTLEADNLRRLYQSPILDIDGSLITSQNNDKEVWALLHKLLETRMRKGEFIVINATHYRNSMLNQYKKLIKEYRYRAYVVDFTDVSLDTLLERNSTRNSYEYVPVNVITKMYKLLSLEKDTPTYAKLISKEEAESIINEFKPFSYDNYNKVVVFGDIHGCYEPIEKWFSNNPYDENTAYIFTGDYVDRGIQNKEVLEFLIKLSKNKNVLLLEGNHEKWLRMYANDDNSAKQLDGNEYKIISKYDKSLVKTIKDTKIRSKEFIVNTIPQIESIDIKHIRGLCSKFAQLAYITFRGREIFICHGGVSSKPSVLIPAYQLIEGVGKYTDIESLYKTWENSNITVVHAHRNVLQDDIKVANNIYNLCDTIEYGGNLRVLVFNNDGTIETHKIKNNVYKYKEEETVKYEDTLSQLEESPLIIKKDFGNISSYNFSRKAFNNRIWNDLTCKARGLFVDNKSRKVVMRSYNKFFSISECASTKCSSLEKNLVFPLACYKKENGFLAMITYYNGSLLFGSKSSIDSIHVEYIKEVFYSLPKLTQDTVEQYLKEHNVTMVFECINSKDNTHPIWYSKNHLYLLDIIYNDFEFKKESYEFVQAFANIAKLEYKELVTILNSFDDFWKFVTKYDYNRGVTLTHEGFVFEDSVGFMFKYKTPFYKYWKNNRKYLEDLQHNRPLKFVFKDEEDVELYQLLKSLDNLNNLTIVDIEKLFYGDKLKPVD